jgi:hypothetical protein
MGDYFTLRIDTFRIPPESELRERSSLRPTAGRARMATLRTDRIASAKAARLPI